MRIRVQVGDADVDVGKQVERGLNELEQAGRRAVDGIRRRVPTKERIVDGINSVIESRWGVRFVAVEPEAVAPPVASHSVPRPARRAVSPKRRSRRKKRR